MAGSPRNSLGSVRSDMDIAYPEHLSRLNRHLVSEYSKPHTKCKRQSRPRNRYRTQPVTFDEIQEVDEENSLLEDHDPNPQSKFDFFKLLESKRKDLSSIRARVNGEPAVQLDHLRRTDKGREGSI
ncbi:unnamed protein product [Larinioides sclopetarius]|uniref:Uncharacterized protein n=1 Tax=Larinioides sclopetarius TaxID=280406 RepID=A0AAV2AEE6_9ARAC